MPASVVGLVLFVALVVPGLVYTAQRRAREPLRTTSPLVEAGTLATVSLITNTIAVVLFGIVRLFASGHTPDPRRIVDDGWGYSAARLGYIGLWSTGLLIVSCGLAFVWGRAPGWLTAATARLAPSTLDVPVWFQIFESVPTNHVVHLGCDLRDGSYIAGYLDWYVPEVNETADRDLALAAPIVRKRDDVEEELDIERVVLSARDLVCIYVAYVPDDEVMSDVA